MSPSLPALLFASLLLLSPSLPVRAQEATPPAAVHPTRGPILDVDYPGTMVLQVDATDLDRRIFSVQQTIPVQPGPLTLLFPEWIPGKHRPDGPIHKLAGLIIQGNGRRIDWTRDPTDVHAFDLVVPAGTTALDLSFQMLTPTSGGQGRIVMTPDMFNLQWDTVVLYPAGYYASRIPVAASLVLPPGWQAGTALALAARTGDTLRYETQSLETLQDSPVFAGRYFERIDLDPGAQRPVRLNIVADAPRYLDASREQIDKHREMIVQSYKLFESQHFDRYDFLFALSDRMGGIGLEHHRSSENAVAAEFFTQWDQQVARRSLLPHEFVHSWNGKFRRPADLWTPNFNMPMADSLLWVYEGQTTYWGLVLAARSGLWDRQTALDSLAVTAATYSDDRPGFAWRNVQDTTNDPIIAARRPQAYRSWQLSEDYYSAGALIWLAVDARLRELSGGGRSLDDFASAFFGMQDGSWDVSTYTFEDVVATLDGIADEDWASFLRRRLDANAAPLDGLAASGWRLVYTDTPNDYQKAASGAGNSADYIASLGIAVSNADSTVGSVRWDSPAFDAGIAPGSTLLAVNGYAYESGRLDDAIQVAQADGTPIELVVQHGDAVRTVSIDYRGDLRYPHLERIDGTSDRLSEILAPL